MHRETLCSIPSGIIGLLTGLYSGAEIDLKCWGGVEGCWRVQLLFCGYGSETGMRLCSITFQYMYGLGILGRVVDQSHCGASVSNTKITDLVFVDDAVIFAESMEVLMMALEALHKEAKPLGLQVFWRKTKVQVFGGLLDETL